MLMVGVSERGQVVLLTFPTQLAQLALARLPFTAVLSGYPDTLLAVRLS
jgi:hypothetical protein